MSWRVGSKLPIGIVTAAGLLAAAGSVHAQSVQTENLKVSAVIGDLCTVTTASLEFGSNYDGSVNVDKTGDIAVNCIGDTEFDVALNGGQDGNGGGQRKMTNGSGGELAYVLYTDPGHADTWDDGERVPADITGSGSVPVYGRIPLGQGTGLAPGLYSDDVVITLHF